MASLALGKSLLSLGLNFFFIYKISRFITYHWGLFLLWNAMTLNVLAFWSVPPHRIMTLLHGRTGHHGHHSLTRSPGIRANSTAGSTHIYVIMTQTISSGTAKSLMSKIWHNVVRMQNSTKPAPGAGVLMEHSCPCSASAWIFPANSFTTKNTGAQQKWWQDHHDAHSASWGMWFQYAPLCAGHCGRYFIVCLSTASFLCRAGQVARAIQIQLDVGFFVLWLPFDSRKKVWFSFSCFPSCSIASISS